MCLSGRIRRAFCRSATNLPGTDRSHALRGNASRDAPRPVTRSVTGCIPTRTVRRLDVGTIRVPS
ncbi:hypothetical protein CUN61_03690 [Pseudomonas arsenicoxydans]|uniref:DUF1534 domain-containing protein n=1 Tax=Pseudomonas arsenicoxydans TaxID=702115 RepID=A0A4V0YJC1_9PSED|nr:hypothetical protein CUN61_03690 [Pseudomonas arsenicoxydans]